MYKSTWYHILILTAILTAIFGQHSFVQGQTTIVSNQQFIKSIPVSIENAPSWAKLMYGDNPNLYDIELAYQNYYSEHIFEKNIHTQNYKHWIQRTKDLVGPNGFVQTNEHDEYELLLNQHKQQRQTSASAKDVWKNIGPNQTYKNNGSLEVRPTQANVYCIAVAPTNTNVLYCGSESGGLFKTTDKGLNWTLIAKDEIITNASDIKVSPLDENNLILGFGNDIYKSIDGGESWLKVYDGMGKIEQFYYLPGVKDNILAATANGLLRSTNNGDDWIKVLDYKCWDIVGHPTNPAVVYLSIQNKNAQRAELYKSMDNGNTWVAKTNKWYVPADLNYARDIGCKIAVSKADPKRIYACLIGESKENDNGWIGIYYSLDEGENWINADGIDGGPYASGSDASTNWFVAGYSSGYHQGWYNFDLAISANDPDRLWLGTIWFCESRNRGKNLEYIRGTRQLEMHADIQDIDVVGDEIWIVSDGGINFSNDECQTVETRNNGITASNYWGFSQGWNEDTWTGGRYHNGDAVFHENFDIANTMFMGGAEASTGYINPMDNRRSYYSDINSIITPDALNIPAQSFSKLGLYPNESYSTLNSSEIEHDPRYANTMYLGRDNVFYKSIDGGQTFEGLFEFDQDSRLLEFEISRSNPHVIYIIVKNNGCQIHKSIDGGNSFVQTTSLPTSNRSTYDLSLDPQDENNLWVILHNGSNGHKVFNTKDGCQSWINMTTSELDNHRIFDVVYQSGTNNIVYIVTSTALFYWDRNDKNWIMYADGLPFLIRPLKMIPFYRDNKLRLSSSRGIWEAPLVEVSSPIAQPITTKESINCFRKKVQFEDYSAVSHTDVEWLWEFPGASEVSSTTIRNPVVSYDSVGSYDVTLTVMDGLGNSNSKTVHDMITVGADYCATDKDPLNALYCHGSNVYAENNSIHIDNVDHFTFTGWIKPEGIQADYTGIFSLGTVNSQKSVLNFRGGNNTLGFHWNSGHWGWNSNLIVPSDEWSFIAMTVTPTEVTLYVNDKEVKSNITTTPIHIRQILLGTYYGWGSRNYQGLIEEACFWDRSLNRDEIRLARHLTKQDISDPNMMAYYQFNNNDGGVIYDKVKTNDLLINGAQLLHSSAPVGAGKSQKLDVNKTGTFEFDTSNVKIKFGDMDKLPFGEIVATELEVLSESKDIIDESSINLKYWILNNYGSNKTLDSIGEIIFLNIEHLDKISDPKNLILYQREENSGEISDWNSTARAHEISTSDKTASFPGSKLSKLGQYFIAEDVILSSNNNKKRPNSSIVYPNPVLRGDRIHFVDLENEYLFILYDEQGKEIIKKRVDRHSKIEVPSALIGKFYYHLISSKKMNHGKLIVQ